MIEWGIALLMAVTLASMALWPTGLRPEDLDLEIISVRALPPMEGYPQRVEVQVRWHWRQPPRTAHSWDVLAIAADRGRWVVSYPGSGIGPNDPLLSLLELPPALWGNRVNPGERGEHTFILSGQDAGRFYEAKAVTLHIHFIHEAPDRTGWPGRTWVKSVGGTYTLEP